MLAATTRIRLLYLLHLSKPVHDRLVYQTVHEKPIASVLELGIGVGQRAQRILEIAAHRGQAEPMRYIGVDEFEGRGPTAGPGLTLKDAHRLLHATGARIRLLPGDPLAVLSRHANNLGQVDLLIVSANVNQEAMRQAWFFIPRMLHERSLTLVEDKNAMRLLNSAEIAKLADSARSRRAA